MHCGRDCVYECIIHGFSISSLNVYFQQSLFIPANPTEDQFHPVSDWWPTQDMCHTKPVNCGQSFGLTSHLVWNTFCKFQLRVVAQIWHTLEAIPSSEAKPEPSLRAWKSRACFGKGGSDEYPMWIIESLLLSNYCLWGFLNKWIGRRHPGVSTNWTPMSWSISGLATGSRQEDMCNSNALWWRRFAHLSLHCSHLMLHARMYVIQWRLDYVCQTVTCIRLVTNYLHVWSPSSTRSRALTALERYWTRLSNASQWFPDPSA